MPNFYSFGRSIAPTLSIALALSILSPVAFATINANGSFSKANSSSVQLDVEHSNIPNAPLIFLASSGEAVNDQTTSTVVRTLGEAVRECKGAGDAYAASCLSRALKRANVQARNPDYFDARRELKSAAGKLDKLVAQNVDRKAGKKRGKFGSYKAIKQEAISVVKQEAIKIIRETETKLLRSSGDELRKIHYKRIAQAVGSTKVIFRS